MTELGWPEAGQAGESALGWPQRASVPPPDDPPGAPEPIVVSRETPQQIDATASPTGPTSWMLGPLIPQAEAADDQVVSRETTVGDPLGPEMTPVTDLDEVDEELLATAIPPRPEVWPRPSWRRLITV